MDSSAQLTANFHIAEGIKSLLGKRKKPDTRGECCESPRKVQKISEQTPASMILIHDVEADNVRMNAPAVAQSLPILKLPSTSTKITKDCRKQKGIFGRFLAAFGAIEESRILRRILRMLGIDRSK